MQKAASRIEAASALSFQALLDRHINDYRSLFTRITLEMGDEAYADIPTDALLNRYTTGETNWTI